ncbi:MAG: lipase family alpha/beta hydrolase [Gammaproteobacteria bacterium]
MRHQQANHVLVPWVLLVAALFTPAASAATVVFVHGYLGDGNSFREPGIVAAFTRAGWRDGGNINAANVQSGRWPAAGGDMVLTVALPSEAPVRNQGQWLGAMLAGVTGARADDLYVVAHSAGGVVARMALVTRTPEGFAGLVTIASPHLGTEAAETGRMIGNSPLGMLGMLPGLNKLSRSQGLYADLVRPRPGTALYWLNSQTHPAGRYISIVRSGRQGSSDMIVPEWSQDMNNVTTLRGLSRTIRTGGGHLLQRSDGPLLVKLLR